jgi:hypothetical protein
MRPSHSKHCLYAFYACAILSLIDYNSFLFLFLNEKQIDGLSTIVWVFIFVQPNLPSRVRRLGQKVLPCKHFEERQPLIFGL